MSRRFLAAVALSSVLLMWLQMPIAAVSVLLALNFLLFQFADEQNIKVAELNRGVELLTRQVNDIVEKFNAE